MPDTVADCALNGWDILWLAGAYLLWRVTWGWRVRT